jgi:hypothetical protein
MNDAVRYSDPPRDQTCTTTITTITRDVPAAASPPQPDLARQSLESLMNVSTLIRSLALASLFAAGTAAASQAASNPLADSVRAANDRFKDVSVAAAEGYAPIPCASGIAGGAMGIHYVNPNYLKDDAIDLARPEAVMYEPAADGALTLIAVEYITSKGPAELQGHLFSFTGAPNRYGLGPFYELHVWAWKANPTGTFADMNPDVSCDAMKPASK